jgi:hypothetical protein
MTTTCPTCNGAPATKFCRDCGTKRPEAFEFRYLNMMTVSHATIGQLERWKEERDESGDDRVPYLPLRLALDELAEKILLLAAEKPAPSAAPASDLAHLTYAAELLKAADPTAKASNGATAITVLLLLSRHNGSVVREGAVYGMGGHLGDLTVRARLREMAKDDASPGVREAASDELDDIPLVAPSANPAGVEELAKVLLPILMLEARYNGQKGDPSASQPAPEGPTRKNAITMALERGIEALQISIPDHHGSKCSTTDDNCVRCRSEVAIEYMQEALKSPAPEGLPEVATTLERIRASGWMVAVHNDYRQHEQFHTFWLFTKDGQCVKGEGHSDMEALAEVWRRVAQAEPSKEPTE